MNKCPKCGGTNGFTYLFTMTTSRSGSWGLDVDEETDVIRTLPVNSVKCIDCGKRVDFDVAHGFVAVEHRVQPTASGVGTHSENLSNGGG